MLHETIVSHFASHPIKAFRLTVENIGRKAALKDAFAKNYRFSPARLPYNQDILTYISDARESGRKVILASGSNGRIVRSISEYLGIFDDVLASDAKTNLTGALKLQAIRQLVGSDNFEYIGNASVDLILWESATLRGIVSNSHGLISRLKSMDPSTRVFTQAIGPIRETLKAIRLHQWVKNLLLFIPLIAAYGIGNGSEWVSTLLGFVAFSTLASASYVVNDLADIENDRANLHKSKRPFANGTISIPKGLLTALSLGILSFAISSALGIQFFFCILAYLGLTVTYSLLIKKLALVDIVTIALLFTLRIIAGGAAAGIEVSFWLLILSFFLFVSFALVKRYAELEHVFRSGGDAAKGRGYRSTDLPLIQAMGVGSGLVAVLVLALYLDSDTVRFTYAVPEIGLLALPAFLLFNGRIWLKAHRGEMHQDPVVFAIRDLPSLLSLLFLVATLLVSHFGVK